MSGGCDLLSNGFSELTVRHSQTGHVFVYSIVGGDLLLGLVREGAGPKDPGDVAADAHAFAKQEAKRLGLI